MCVYVGWRIVLDSQEVGLQVLQRAHLNNVQVRLQGAHHFGLPSDTAGWSAKLSSHQVVNLSAVSTPTPRCVPGRMQVTWIWSVSDWKKKCKNSQQSLKAPLSELRRITHPLAVPLFVFLLTVQASRPPGSQKSLVVLGPVLAERGFGVAHDTLHWWCHLHPTWRQTQTVDFLPHWDIKKAVGGILRLLSILEIQVRLHTARSKQNQVFRHAEYLCWKQGQPLRSSHWSCLVNARGGILTSRLRAIKFSVFLYPLELLLLDASSVAKHAMKVEAPHVRPKRRRCRAASTTLQLQYLRFVGTTRGWPLAPGTEVPWSVLRESFPAAPGWQTMRLLRVWANLQVLPMPPGGSPGMLSTWCHPAGPKLLRWDVPGPTPGHPWASDGYHPAPQHSQHEKLLLPAGLPKLRHLAKVCHNNQDL